MRSHGVLGVRVLCHLFLLLTALCLFLQPVTHPSHCLPVWTPAMKDDVAFSRPPQVPTFLGCCFRSLF